VQFGDVRADALDIVEALLVESLEAEDVVASWFSRTFQVCKVASRANETRRLAAYD